MSSGEREKGSNRPYLKYILHIAVITGIIIAAVRYLDFAEIIAALQEFDLIYLPFLIALSAGYMFLKALRFIPLMRPVTGLPPGVLFRGYVAGTAATLVPGGVAARAGLMRQAGVPFSDSSGPVILSSLLDQLAFLASSLIAAIWFEAVRTPAFILLGIVLGIVAALFIPVTRRLILKAVNWVADKFNFTEQWESFRKAWSRVATPRILALTFGITLFGLIFQILMLDFSLRGVGVTIPYPLIFMAYIVPAMLGRLSALPGGVGVTEVGMVGFLVLTANVDIHQGTAATVIFRLITLFFQILLGALVYFFVWGGERESKRIPQSEKETERSWKQR
jgi:uncharacterized protein (TIRG00374 family)